MFANNDSKLPAQQVFILVLGVICVIALPLRLFKLDGLPSEIYGDIIIIYEYLLKILNGEWPVNFYLSAGPLYQYLIIPVIKLFGLSYFSIKIASVLVSCLCILGIWLFASEIEPDRAELGLLASLIGSVSIWFLIFSRLGNSQILLPLVTILALWLALRTVRTGKLADLLGCVFVSVLGLYTYPQLFILPGVVFISLLALWYLHGGIRWSDVLIFIGVTLLGAIPFLLLVSNDPENFFTGYIGEKLPTGDLLKIIATNIWNAALALHVQGDIIFRSNVSKAPQLDLISGVLFLLGIVYWLSPERRRLSPILFIPFLLLQVPSVMVRYVIQVPSASRTIAVVPIVYILVASGLLWLIDLLRSNLQLSKGIMSCLVGFILVGITYLNSSAYFTHYAQGLPGGNTAYHLVMSDYFQTLPNDAHIIIRGCCWAKWEQPQQLAISYTLQGPQKVTFVAPEELTCNQLLETQAPSYLVWSPKDESFSRQLAGCIGDAETTIFRSKIGEDMFRIVKIR
jgi:hypothetical protein